MLRASEHCDWLAIQNLIGRYAELLNTGQFDEVGKLFEHGRVVVDGNPNPVSGPTEVAEMYRESTRVPSTGPDSLLYTTNTQIEVDGDVARAKSYFVALHDKGGGQIATVVGAIAGGAIANRVADEHRTVATIVGAIAGAVIGNRIGRELDEADRGCFGHALEIAAPGQRVTWTNESQGVRYELSPGAASPRHGASCREYTLVTAAGRRDRTTQTGVACQSAPGVWQVAR